MKRRIQIPLISGRSQWHQCRTRYDEERGLDLGIHSKKVRW